MRAVRRARGSQLLASASVSQAPGGTSLFLPSLQRSTASKGWFLSPVVVPEVAQLSHTYTSITRGRASPPRGVGNGGPVPGPIALGSLCSPCRLRPWLLRLLRRCLPGPPRRQGSGHPRRFHPRFSRCWVGPVRGAAVRVGGRLVGGLGGLGGNQVRHVVVDVVDALVLVVGVVRRHLLDKGGEGPHRLDIWLRARPAPLSSPCDLPFPPPAPVPCPACPREATLPFPSLPPGCLPPACPLARVAGRQLCHPRPCLFR